MDVEWLLVGKAMMCIYDCWLGIEMNDMYNIGINMNCMAEIHDHAIVGTAFDFNHRAHQSDFERIAMAVQVAALALVVGDPVAGVEFQFAGDGKHR